MGRDCSYCKDPSQFGFKTQLRVRLDETDAVGVVFFGEYASYFDVGRMEYLANLGLHKMDGAVRDLIPGMVVHQEACYLGSAGYNDLLTVYVRTAAIGTTSYTLHFLITEEESDRVIAVGEIVLAWMDLNGKTMPVPGEFREKVSAFEGRKFSNAA